VVLPLGHGKAIRSARSLSRRERRLITAVLGGVAALVVVLVVAIGTAGKSSGHGCIHATIAGPVGAEEIDQCGSQARATCLSVAVPGTFTVQAAQAIGKQCRKAGLPVGQ
jgi:hypothetical protein